MGEGGKKELKKIKSQIKLVFWEIKVKLRS
jgi:hypothetical protein